MAIRIHHNSAKRAKRLGLELKVSENEVEVYRGARMLASSPMANKALDAAEALLKSEQPKPVRAPRTSRVEDGDDADDAEDQEIDEDEGVEEAASDEDDAEEDGDDEGKSIVKRKYKSAYRPFKQKCGDDLSGLISQHVTREIEDPETGDVVRRVDVAALRKFAKANDCWVPGYANLNVGQARMNVGNRLRAKVRKGHTIAWV